MKEWEIWSEGYLATGMEGIPETAQLMGKFVANSFKEACDKWAATLTDPYSKSCYDGERLMFWACGLFDNEADARKSFG
jgi:hypothetical protein